MQKYPQVNLQIDTILPTSGEGGGGPPLRLWLRYCLNIFTTMALANITNVVLSLQIKNKSSGMGICLLTSKQRGFTWKLAGYSDITLKYFLASSLPTWYVQIDIRASWWMYSLPNWFYNNRRGQQNAGSVRLQRRIQGRSTEGSPMQM